ncbi:MAG: RDD family protein [Acidobacteriota bacterium]
MVIFGAIFSFAYAVVPLAFWGQTPGMAWAGIVARTTSGESLSFGQAARRWLGGWITALLGGVPGLLALSGRSLVDRLSGSRTLNAPAVAHPPARRAA